MVALTITIIAAVLIVLIIAAVRSLSRASRQIDDIIREELEAPPGYATEPVQVDEDEPDDDPRCGQGRSDV